ncbi:hypothetical protein FACS1894198_0590 [Clostridia bacterium]|nr:hypothetical protein FACS1894198_0590 [Clostridia bacterium]
MKKIDDDNAKWWADHDAKKAKWDADNAKLDADDAKRDADRDAKKAKRSEDHEKKMKELDEDIKQITEDSQKDIVAHERWMIRLCEKAIKGYKRDLKKEKRLADRLQREIDEARAEQLKYSRMLEGMGGDNSAIQNYLTVLEEDCVGSERRLRKCLKDQDGIKENLEDEKEELADHEKELQELGA